MNSEELRVDIDENGLLEEWRGQASLMFAYGTRLADARAVEDAARVAVDVVKAELDRDIRESPDMFGVAKPTESAVAAAVLCQGGYQRAVEKLNAARHEVRLLGAAVDAISHRKAALQGITDLFLRQWYADPKSGAQPRELREAAAGGPPTKVIKQRRVRRGKNEE